MEEFFLGGDDRLNEVFWRRGLGECFAVGGVFEDFAECADDLEIIGGVRFRSAEDEHQFHGLVAVFEEHALVAATDGHDDFMHVLGAGVGEGNLVAETGGVEAFAGEELVVEALEIGDVGMAVEQAGNFVKRDGALVALDVQADERRIEESGETAGHA